MDVPYDLTAAGNEFINVNDCSSYVCTYLKVNRRIRRIRVGRGELEVAENQPRIFKMDLWFQRPLLMI